MPKLPCGAWTPWNHRIGMLLRLAVYRKWYEYTPRERFPLSDDFIGRCQQVKCPSSHVQKSENALSHMSVNCLLRQYDVAKILKNFEKTLKYLEQTWLSMPIFLICDYLNYQNRLKITFYIKQLRFSLVSKLIPKIGLRLNFTWKMLLKVLRLLRFIMLRLYEINDLLKISYKVR